MIQRLEDNIENHGEWLNTATKNKTDDMKIKRTNITRKQKWEEKNFVDVLSDEQATSHTRKRGCG